MGCVNIVRTKRSSASARCQAINSVKSLAAIGALGSKAHAGPKNAEPDEPVNL
jgi:hypothetical protein